MTEGEGYMRHTHLLWDFNGTIMDDVQAGIDSVNIMLAERGLATIPSVEKYRSIFDFPIEDYYRSLGFDFEAEPYEVLAPIWVALYEEHSKRSPLCEGVRETLASVCSLGVKQSVLSACELEMLERNLKNYGVNGYFEEVLGLDNIHARSKTHLAIEWRERNPDAVPLFLGDTTHDAAVAEAIGADCVLYSGGHQSREKLERTGYPVIDDVRRVVDYL